MVEQATVARCARVRFPLLPPPKIGTMINIFRFITFIILLVASKGVPDARDFSLIWSAIRVVIHCGIRHNDWVQYDHSDKEFYFLEGLMYERSYRNEEFYCINCDKVIYTDKIVPKYIIP